MFSARSRGEGLLQQPPSSSLKGLRRPLSDQGVYARLDGLWGEGTTAVTALAGHPAVTAALAAAACGGG
jgi:hypothetical protein